MAKYLYTPFFDRFQVRDVMLDAGFQDSLLKGNVVRWEVLNSDSDLSLLENGDEIYVVAHSNNETGTMYDKFTDSPNGRGNELNPTQLVWQMTTQGLPQRQLKIHLYGCLTGVRNAFGDTFAYRVARVFGQRGYAQVKVYGYVGFVTFEGNTLRVAKALSGEKVISRLKDSTQRIVKYDANGNVLRGIEGRRYDNDNSDIRIRNT